MRVWSLGQEDPLEKEMANHSSILPGESHGQRSLVGYSPRGSQRVRHNWVHTHTYVYAYIHTHTHTHIGCCFRTYWKYYIMHSMHVLSFYNLINFGFQNVCNLRVCKHGIQELFKGLPCMLWSNNNFTSFNIKRGIIYFLSSCVCLFLITEH